MYKINSINNVAKTLGKTVAKDADYTYDELKKYISVGNIKNILSDYAIKKDNELYINSEGINNVMSDILDWLTGRELAYLAAQDKLDCYWDDTTNEMVFKSKN